MGAQCLTFSENRMSAFLKNPARKSVARMWRVATSSSFLVETALWGQVLMSAITLPAIVSW